MKLGYLKSILRSRSSLLSSHCMFNGHGRPRWTFLISSAHAWTNVDWVFYFNSIRDIVFCNCIGIKRPNSDMSWRVKLRYYPPIPSHNWLLDIEERANVTAYVMAKPYIKQYLCLCRCSRCERCCRCLPCWSSWSWPTILLWFKSLLHFLY